MAPGCAVGAVPSKPSQAIDSSRGRGFLAKASRNKRQRQKQKAKAKHELCCKCTCAMPWPVRRSRAQCEEGSNGRRKVLASAGSHLPIVCSSVPLWRSKRKYYKCGSLQESVAENAPRLIAVPTTAAKSSVIPPKLRGPDLIKSTARDAIACASLLRPDRPVFLASASTLAIEEARSRTAVNHEVLTTARDPSESGISRLHLESAPKNHRKLRSSHLILLPFHFCGSLDHGHGQREMRIVRLWWIGSVRQFAQLQCIVLRYRKHAEKFAPNEKECF